MSTCTSHPNHAHTHSPECGHASTAHGDHVDYFHDGHIDYEGRGHWTVTVTLCTRGTGTSTENSALPKPPR
jgi:hypothetical protein